MLPEVRRAIKFSIQARRRASIFGLATTLALLFSVAATAQDTSTLLLLRPVPKVRKGEPPSAVAPLAQSDIAAIKIGGKPATITAWTPLLKGSTTLQLVVLLDSAQRMGINHQFEDIRTLFNDLPANVEIAVGYLLQGKAQIVQPFTADHTLAGDALHDPSGSGASPAKADNGDPYYCLQDLALHWPDPDPAKVRAVLVFTDGTVRYNNSGYGAQTNPTVDIAAASLMRAGIAPFAIYYSDRSSTAMPGQTERKGCTDCLDQLAATTNGQALYSEASQTTGSSFSSLLYRFLAILHSEAVVTVTAKGAGLKPIDIKSSRDDLKITGPESIMIGNALPRR